MSNMAVNLTGTSERPHRRLTKDVNGLLFVFGVLAVMMVTLPCPMSEAGGAVDLVPEPSAISATKR